MSWGIWLQGAAFAAHAAPSAVTFLRSGSHVGSASRRSLRARKEGTILSAPYLIAPVTITHLKKGKKRSLSSLEELQSAAFLTCALSFEHVCTAALKRVRVASFNLCVC